METFDFRGATVSIPTGLFELEAKHYPYYCLLGMALASGAVDADYFRIRLISYLAGMENGDFTLLLPEVAAPLEERLHMMDAFLVKRNADGAERLFADFDSVRNLLPEHRGYRGPGDMLQGMTFGQFTECVAAMEGIDPEDAGSIADACDHVARCMYAIPEHEKVPPLLSWHASSFFGSVWRMIMREPIEVNGRKIDFRIIFRSSGPRRPDDRTGWTGIAFEVASANVFGNLKDVNESDMWQVLMYLYKCKFEYIHDNKRQ